MRRHTLRLCYCSLLCALMILSTLLFRFVIPGTNVMVTLQVLFVLLCGQLLPVRYCLYTTGAYLLAGLIGLPVFSSVSGLAVVSTPSFGYLLGFPLCAAICSAVRQTGKKGSRWWASFAGIGVLYAVAIGYILLLSSLYVTEAVAASSLLTSYCLVFLPLDLLKGLAAAWLGKRLNKLSLQLG